MGQLRFWSPGGESSSPNAKERANLAGLEGVPWRSDNYWEEDELVVERDITESGYLCVPWSVEGRGELALYTASLMERWEAYNLPLELARGTLNRVRNQLDSWASAGLVVSPKTKASLSASLEHFAKAATREENSPASVEMAQRSVVEAVAAAESLASEYVEQVLRIRHQHAAKLGVMFAGSLQSRPFSRQEQQWFLSAFNSARTSFTWAQIEAEQGSYDFTIADAQAVWRLEQNVKIAAGPVLDLSEHALPDWLILFSDDFEKVSASAAAYCEAVARRYRGQAHVWNAASGFHGADLSIFDEEQKVRLAVTAIEAVRRGDPRAPVIVSFDQPWAEYLRGRNLDLSPLHIADALLRAELGLHGIGLEINFGYWPEGTPARDMLDVSLQIDRWASLGLPLIIYLTAPSAADPDPKARRAAKPLTLGRGGPPTPQGQAEAAEDLVQLCLAKPSVHGVIWNQTLDGVAHDFPHGGWIDAAGNVKPMHGVLTDIRRKHLT